MYARSGSRCLVGQSGTGGRLSLQTVTMLDTVMICVRFLLRVGEVWVCGHKIRRFGWHRRLIRFGLQGTTENNNQP